jgi:hypothetical protein
MAAFDRYSGGSEIAYVRTADGGLSFAPPIVVSDIDEFNS